MAELLDRSSHCDTVSLLLHSKVDSIEWSALLKSLRQIHELFGYLPSEHYMELSLGSSHRIKRHSAWYSLWEQQVRSDLSFEVSNPLKQLQYSRDIAWLIISVSPRSFGCMLMSCRSAQLAQTRFRGSSLLINDGDGYVLKSAAPMQLQSYTRMKEDIH